MKSLKQILLEVLSTIKVIKYTQEDKLKQLEMYFIMTPDGDVYTSYNHRHYDIIEFIYPESKKLDKGDGEFGQYKYAIKVKGCVRGKFAGSSTFQLEFDRLSENQKIVFIRMINKLNIRNFEVDRWSENSSDFRYETLDKEEFIETFL